MDRIFDTPDGPVAFALMALFLVIGLALVAAGILQRTPAVERFPERASVPEYQARARSDRRR